jgi:DNA-directed RNA polymerase specialized sigma24 family protein
MRRRCSDARPSIPMLNGRVELGQQRALPPSRLRQRSGGCQGRHRSNSRSWRPAGCSCSTAWLTRAGYLAASGILPGQSRIPEVTPQYAAALRAAAGWIAAASAAQAEVTNRRAAAQEIHNARQRRYRALQQAAALLLWFQSMSKASVGLRMGIRESTVRQYIDRARVKYARTGRPAPTKTALLARAIEDGLIRADEVGDYQSHAAVQRPLSDARPTLRSNSIRSSTPNQ